MKDWSDISALLGPGYHSSDNIMDELELSCEFFEKVKQDDVTKIRAIGAEGIKKGFPGLRPLMVNGSPQEFMWLVGLLSPDWPG